MQCRRGGMVDTIDSKSIAREGVRVQVSSPVKKKVTDTSAKKRRVIDAAFLIFRGNFKNTML